MIWQIDYDDAPWATVVVRAPNGNDAVMLGMKIGKDYMDDPGRVSARRIEPDGPTESLIEDWS